MAFTFLHTADWQLGKPFRSFEARTSSALEEERFNVLDRLAHAARQAGARHVLVAGDVFDAERPRARTLHWALERMKAAPTLTWHLLAGNHDPARPGGVWDTVASIGPPDNVVAHIEAAPVELERGVVLLTAPLKAKGFSADPTAGMDATATPPGTIRIGLAHGTIQSIAGEGESTARIDPARTRKAGLAYLALGDWHGMTRIDDRTWYSGTPEPDRFPNNDPGHALIVRIDGADARPQVKPVDTAHFAWARHAAEIRSAGELARVERFASGLAPTLNRVLLRLSLTGTLPASEHAGVARWTRELGERLRCLDCDTTGLRLSLGTADLGALAAAPDLRRAAERLMRMADDAGEQRRSAAQIALARLYELADAAPGMEDG